MTKQEAEVLTKLDARENGKARNDYLCCQLGHWEDIRVQTSAYRSVMQKVFRLVAFGDSWEKAVSMWENQQKKETI